MHEHHLTVPRTARYHTLGDAANARAIWIVLHGYGQLARYFLRKFEGMEDGLLIAAPEGLSRFYTDEAHSRVGATWMTREDRAHEIEDQITYLDALADVLLGTTGEFPLNVLGFSQGVATACRWSLQGRTTIHRMVIWAGGLPPEAGPEQLHSAWNKLDLHLVLGSHDQYAGDNELQAQSARLRMAKVPHQVHRFQGGHELEQGMLARLLMG
ncbi:MAG: phospholipase [Bacteroidetes bacterium]|jgi:predicted esterase|nr:phospholipase [Bacteroidota bacterium]